MSKQETQRRIEGWKNLCQLLQNLPDDAKEVIREEVGSTNFSRRSGSE